MSDNRGFKAFLCIWLGQLISSIGSGLTSFGLNVYVFEQSKSALACSIVTLCAFLPMVLLTPFSGVLADRFSRKKLMLIGDSFSAICLLVLLVMVITKNDSVALICICVFSSSIFASLMDPAYKSAVTDLLTKDQFSKAGGLIQLASAAKFLISPIIAGLIIKLGGINTILLIDICTFFITLFTVVIAGKQMEKSQHLNKDSKLSFFKDFADGWKSLTKNHGVVVLMLLATLITFYVGVIETLLTPMLLEITDSSTLGVITSVSAIGMLVTSLVLGIKGIKNGYVRLLATGFAIMGIMIGVVGCLTNLVLIAVFGFLFFAMIPLTNTCIDVLLRSNLDQDTQGREWGLISFVTQIGYIVAYGISGALADYVFNPLLRPDGLLATTVGRVVGTGMERGIAFMLIICGFSMIILSVVIYCNKSMKKIENIFIENIEDISTVDQKELGA
ncbi:MFS transporter [Butyrivibrio sp. MC2021]|uniref:MFS transporter n=1 Tax=Butyrivibrio sp. MC2021 TaxID=1408306 RepID=UPI0009DFCFD2|nr:MFS transporter [Butyrivibrio sp. MC2021]